MEKQCCNSYLISIKHLIHNLSIFCFYTYNTFLLNQVHTFLFVSVYIILIGLFEVVPYVYVFHTTPKNEVELDF